MWFKVPETIQIKFDGTLPDGVMAKDLILRVLGDFGNGGLTYRAIEFSGSTIDEMEVDQRLCLSNMTVEGGAKAGLIQPDLKTFDYLKTKMEPGNFESLEPAYPDVDANYCESKRYQTEEIRPLIALPHNPENVAPIEEVEKVELDQAYIGSCAGGRLSDLAAAALILKDRKVSSSIRMIVCPASRTVYQQALKQGILDILYESGAIITAAGCGACGGGHSGVLGANERCISSTNRNFKGRMGDPSSMVYLASPLSVAASAVTGKITDPRIFLD
jgi:3-isopropylmalate/(R)-2-methylmalate dehydratase large subunit